jgi:hypothetical protein
MTKKSKNLFIGVTSLFSSAYLLMGSASMALAQIVNPVISEELGGSEGNVADIRSGNAVIRYSILLWRASISIGVLYILTMYLIGAYEWLSSGGDSKGVEKAQSRITNATIGLSLMVGSFVIIGVVGELIFGDNFNILQISIPFADPTAPINQSSN